MNIFLFLVKRPKRCQKVFLNYRFQSSFLLSTPLQQSSATIDCLPTALQWAYFMVPIQSVSSSHQPLAESLMQISFSLSCLYASRVKDVFVWWGLGVKNKFALCFKLWRSQKSVRKILTAMNNEFDSHVQPFTSTRETSWRLHLFKAGLSQGGACKNSSPDQLRERERWRSEGGRCCRELKVFWGWSCQCYLSF